MYVCMYICNLYTQHGVQAHDPKIKSPMFFHLSQPDTAEWEFKKQELK